MKKLVLAGAILLLAGCGENVDNDSTLEEQNKQLQETVNDLQKQVSELQAQLDEQANQSPTNQGTDEVEIVTLKILTTDGNEYRRDTVSVQPEKDENIYEATLRTLFPELHFNKVTENEDGSITIDVNEDSTGSPNMTASAQVATFLDILDYTLYENFPDLLGYYITSNDQPTYLGDFGPFEEMRPIIDITEQEMYLPIVE